MTTRSSANVQTDNEQQNEEPTEPPRKKAKTAEKENAAEEEPSTSANPKSCSPTVAEERNVEEEEDEEDLVASEDEGGPLPADDGEVIVNYMDREEVLDSFHSDRLITISDPEELLAVAQHVLSAAFSVRNVLRVKKARAGPAKPHVAKKAASKEEKEKNLSKQILLLHKSFRHYVRGYPHTKLRMSPPRSRGTRAPEEVDGPWIHCPIRGTMFPTMKRFIANFETRFPCFFISDITDMGFNIRANLKWFQTDVVSKLTNHGALKKSGEVAPPTLANEDVRHLQDLELDVIPEVAEPPAVSSKEFYDDMDWAAAIEKWQSLKKQKAIDGKKETGETFDSESTVEDIQFNNLLAVGLERRATGGQVGVDENLSDLEKVQKLVENLASLSKDEEYNLYWKLFVCQRGLRPGGASEDFKAHFLVDFLRQTARTIFERQLEEQFQHQLSTVSDGQRWTIKCTTTVMKEYKRLRQAWLDEQQEKAAGSHGNDSSMDDDEDKDEDPSQPGPSRIELRPMPTIVNEDVRHLEDLELDVIPQVAELPAVSSEEFFSKTEWLAAIRKFLAVKKQKESGEKFDSESTVDEMQFNHLLTVGLERRITGGQVGVDENLSDLEKVQKLVEHLASLSKDEEYNLYWKLFVCQRGLRPGGASDEFKSRFLADFLHQTARTIFERQLEQQFQHQLSTVSDGQRWKIECTTTVIKEYKRLRQAWLDEQQEKATGSHGNDISMDDDEDEDEDPKQPGPSRIELRPMPTMTNEEDERHSEILEQDMIPQVAEPPAVSSKDEEEDPNQPGPSRIELRPMPTLENKDVRHLEDLELDVIPQVAELPAVSSEEFYNELNWAAAIEKLIALKKQEDINGIKEAGEKFDSESTVEEMEFNHLLAVGLERRATGGQVGVDENLGDLEKVQKLVEHLAPLPKDEEYNMYWRLFVCQRGLRPGGASDEFKAGFLVDFLRQTARTIFERQLEEQFQHQLNTLLDGQHWTIECTTTVNKEYKRLRQEWLDEQQKKAAGSHGNDISMDDNEDEEEDPNQPGPSRIELRPMPTLENEDVRHLEDLELDVIPQVAELPAVSSEEFYNELNWAAAIEKLIALKKQEDINGIKEAGEKFDSESTVEEMQFNHLLAVGLERRITGGQVGVDENLSDLEKVQKLVEHLASLPKDEEYNMYWRLFVCQRGLRPGGASDEFKTRFLVGFLRQTARTIFERQLEKQFQHQLSTLSDGQHWTIECSTTVIKEYKKLREEWLDEQQKKAAGSQGNDSSMEDNEDEDPNQPGPSRIELRPIPSMDF